MPPQDQDQHPKPIDLYSHWHPPQRQTAPSRQLRDPISPSSQARMPIQKQSKRLPIVLDAGQLCDIFQHNYTKFLPFFDQESFGNTVRLISTDRLLIDFQPLTIAFVVLTVPLYDWQGNPPKELNEIFQEFTEHLMRAAMWPQTLQGVQTVLM